MKKYLLQIIVLVLFFSGCSIQQSEPQNTCDEQLNTQEPIIEEEKEEEEEEKDYIWAQALIPEENCIEWEDYCNKCRITENNEMICTLRHCHPESHSGLECTKYIEN